METIVCLVKEAYKLMEYMCDDDMVILLVLNKRSYMHETPKN